jgi:peptide/nickel transport system substrate-binding protein
MTEKPMPGAIRLGRRHFIGGIGGAIAATSFLGLPRVASAEGPLLEAPQLTELVKAGKLPPLAERLPKVPEIVTPVEGVGTYGGTWNMGTTGAGDSAWWWRSSGYGGLTRIDVDTGKAVPNVAESFEASADGTSFRFKLREGLKWSDGEPMTSADIVFWWEDFVLNAELWPAGAPAFMRTASGPGTVTADGDYAVVFAFKEPNGFLPNWLATNIGNPVTAMPKHYLEQFHAAHNPDAEALARKEGFNSWPDLFLNKAGAATLHQAGGLPVVRPWAMQSVLGTGSRLVFERNPYFYKVDTNGSQLPYVDRVVFEIIEDPQVMLLKASNGELNYQLRHFNTPENKPILARNAKEKGYTLSNLVSANMNEGVIALNLTHNDPVKREIYNNKNFRIGLSHALDRTEIINAVYQRQSQPWQAAPRPDTKFYNEKAATQYLEYNVDLANEALDEAGYKNRNAEGIRLGPDGNPIHISFFASTTGGSNEALLIPVQQIMKQQWAAVGIGMDSTAMERSLYITRTGNEEQDALMWTGFGGHPLTIPVDPRWYLPISPNQSSWGAKWAVWNASGGENGEAPPEELQKSFGHYRDALATPDDDERDELLAEVIQIAADGFYVIGTVLALPPYQLKTDNFHNVPATQPDCWPYPSPGQMLSEQFYMS